MTAPKPTEPPDLPGHPLSLFLDLWNLVLVAVGVTIVLLLMHR